MKRVFSWLLVLVLVLGLLAGCGDSKKPADNNSGTASGGNAGALISTEDVNYIAADGSSVYRIIRPEGVDGISSVSSFLFKKMKDALGVNVKNSLDSEDGNDTYEILIGETNRSETATAKQYLSSLGGRYNDYVICTIGKKIVIYSENAEIMQTAVEYFLANFVKKEGVKGGIDYVFKTEGEFKSITVNGVEVGSFDFVRPHYNSSYLTEVEMEEIQSYVLAETGYMMNIVHDTYTADNPGEYEVIVGNTTREGVEAVTDVDGYKIAVKGKKVYINGGSAHATAIAVSEFGKMLKKGNVTDASSLTGSYNATIGSYDKTSEYYQTWGDDFNDIVLDSTKWDLKGTSYSSAAGVGGKLSVRSDDPNDVFIHDGKFYICAREDENYYYGGMIRTEGIMRYKYGYLEMSSIIPHGDGFWVALWACSNDSFASYGDGPKITSPEIDIVECFGNSNYYAANCHAWPTSYGRDNFGYEHTSLDTAEYSSQKKYSSKDAGVNLGDDFHTYGFLWDDTQMGFTCDGDLFFSYATNTSEHDIEAFNHSMYLIFSMACGFESSPLPSVTTNPEEWQNTNKYVLDWLHIYQKEDGKHELYWTP